MEGKILVANYARLNNIPFFGICLGLQIAVIEYCRNVIGLNKANSEEFDAQTDHKVVVFMPEIDKNQMGGTMRLGSRVTIFKVFLSVVFVYFCLFLDFFFIQSFFFQRNLIKKLFDIYYLGQIVYPSSTL